MNNAIVTLSDLGRGRGEGTPLSHIGYVPPQRVGLFSPFDLITGVGVGEGGGVYFAHFGLESEFPGVVPQPPEQVTGWYTILLSLSSETQFLNNDNTVCIVSNLSTLIERF